MATEHHKRTLVTGKTEISTDLDWVYRVAWSPDSKIFALLGSKGSSDQTTYSVLVYDATSHKVMRVLPIRKPGSTTGDIVFSPDGKYLAAGIGVITVWDTQGWRELHEIEGPLARGFVTDGLKSLVFSPDSKSLSALYRRVVWPETIILKTRDEVEARSKVEREVKRAGKFWEKLAKGEIRNFLDTVMTYNVATGRRMFAQPAKTPTPEQSQQFTGNLTYTSDGSYLIVPRVEYHDLKPGEHGRIRTFLEFRDPGTGQLMKEIREVHVMGITAQAISPNALFVATGTDTLSEETHLNPNTKEWDAIDNKDPIRLWDLRVGKEVMEYGPLRGAVKSLAFTPDSTILLSCQTDMEKKETLWLWDVASGQLLERISTPRSGHDFFGCGLSPSGQVIVMPVVGHLYIVTLSN